MKLKIIGIEGKGNLDKEVVWLEAIEDAQLQYYAVCDTTYTDEDTISNELRHFYWFAPRAVKKGDYIALFTKEGKNSTQANEQKTTTHLLYWKQGKTVWNKDGDSAVLFQISSWNTTKAFPKKA